MAVFSIVTACLESTAITGGLAVEAAAGRTSGSGLLQKQSNFPLGNPDALQKLVQQWRGKHLEPMLTTHSVLHAHHILGWGGFGLNVLCTELVQP